MPTLTLHADYSREQVRDIFAPDKPFYRGAGDWGLSGIVNIPQRLRDYVFFVTYGQSESGHDFEESITEDGVLTWQSQPKQKLQVPQIRQFIDHDDLANSIYLFLRTRKGRDYTYLGKLAYLSHDLQREQPVWFQWQILDWGIQQTVLSRIGLTLTTDATTAVPSIAGISITGSPPPRARGTTTATFRARHSVNHGERDARNRTLGLAGEELVVEHERSALKAAGRDDLSQRVSHVAKDEGDGAGYDVRSFTPSGDAKHIEVKTTRGTIDTPFYITSNEVAFSTTHPGTFYLYRLYGLTSGAASMFVLTGNIAERLCLDPVSYRATIAP
jgi:hypothetical protein